MSGLFQYRNIEASKEPKIVFCLSPLDPLNPEEVSAAQDLQEELEKLFNGYLQEGVLTVQDFQTEDEAEVLISYLDEAIEDLEQEIELAVNGVFVCGNIYVISCFIIDPSEDEDDDSDDAQDWS